MSALSHQQHQWEIDDWQAERATRMSVESVNELLDGEMRRKNVRQAKVLVVTDRQATMERRTRATDDVEHREGITLGSLTAKVMAGTERRMATILRGAQQELRDAHTAEAREKLD
ncbi:hypothetical protein BBJ28_00023445 [Nothophytophthora sp. Chile5]|nr:hypothetical protein BBJ28_00023445 [Nothophytophthora sp. Chile5]